MTCSRTLSVLWLALLCLALIGSPHFALAKSAKKPSPQQDQVQGQSPGADPNAQSMVEFFKSEEVQAPKNLDFQITGGYADFRTDSAESSGRYFMVGQTITPVAADIYRLDLTFKRKLQRDIIDYNPEYYFTQQKSYYFWYNGGKRLVFKVGSGKKSFDTSKKEITEIKVLSLETYKVERQKLLLDVQLQDGNASIKLELKFI